MIFLKKKVLKLGVLSALVLGMFALNNDAHAGEFNLQDTENDSNLSINSDIDDIFSTRKIDGQMVINRVTYKWMEASWGNNRGMTINPGRMNYQFSPNPHNDPWYNKNQVKFYNEAARQIQQQGNQQQWQQNRWPNTIRVNVNGIQYTMSVR